MIPGYGSRGWCRAEHFIFSLAAEMRGRKAQLYGIKRDGSLHQYPKVAVVGDGDMPSQGDLSNPNDKALLQAIEDDMIEAYGKLIVETMCKAGAGGKVDLKCKMIRACHAEALCEAVNKYDVKELNLGSNQLDDAGTEAIAAMLRTNGSLTHLDLRSNNGIHEPALAEALRSNTSLTYLDLRGNLGSIDEQGRDELRDAVAGWEGFKLIHDWRL